jgi:hypothetical protein
VCRLHKRQVIKEVTTPSPTASKCVLGRWLNRPVGQTDLELAKWVAVVTMAIDHYGKIVDPTLYYATHAIGRLAFPLFAAIIGMRLAQQPDLATAYLKRLAPWAMISQPVFVLAGREWYEGNVLLTLLLGVGAMMLVRRYAAGRSIFAGAGILVLIQLSWFVEFGPVGVAMIPAIAHLAKWRPTAGLLASGPIGVAANLSVAWPLLQLVDAASIFASAIALPSTRANLRLPRLPTHFFYGFYPAHLLALHFFDLVS